MRIIVRSAMKFAEKNAGKVYLESREVLNGSKYSVVSG